MFVHPTSCLTPYCNCQPQLLFHPRASVIGLPVKMEAHVKVVSQIKDISVFVFRASPQLIVNKVLPTL